jgi:L-threonylcarbamoyladenylate synthase
MAAAVAGRSTVSVRRVTRALPYRTARDRAAAGEAVRRHLEADGLIAYPTETVYGLGCALRPGALRRLVAFKGERPFLLLIRRVEDAGALRWTPAARDLAAAFWPGPLTLVLDDPSGAFPEAVVGPDGGVAVRVSPHPAIAPLLRAAGGPITSTSANRPGDPPPRTAAVAAELGAEIDGLLVLDGGTLPAARPSTVVRCAADVRILRHGPLSRGELETVTEVME